MKNKFSIALSLAVILSMLLTSLALADDISNNLDGTVDATLESLALTAGGGNGTVGLYVQEENGDGKQGCNLTGQTTLVVSVASSNTNVVTVSPGSITFTSCGATPGITVTPVGIGSATISLGLISNDTNGTFNLAPASFTVNVSAPAGKSDQTINFGPLADKTYGNPDFAVSATASSGLSVSFVAAGNCTISGNTVHITGAGLCTITAQQTGNGSYNPAPDVARSFNIAKADATIVVNGYTGTYDGAAHGATGSATGALGEDLSSLLNLGATFTNVPGGNANWTFTGDDNHNPASGSVAITINKANATINVSGYTGTYDGQAHGATGSATGVLGESLSGLNLGASFTNVPGGTANWTFSGGTNYNDASGSVAIVINKANATINVSGYTGTYDGQAHGATGTATGVLGEDLSAGLNLGVSFTNVPGGTANWSFSGGTNYNDASGTAAIVINKAPLTVTADNKTIIFGQSLPPFTFQYSGFVNGEDASVIDTAPTCGVDSIPMFGSYPIVCSGASDNNYSFSYVNGTLTVQAWTLKGFYQPVDMGGVLNTVKNGSTVPLKFEIMAGSIELTDPSYVKSLTYAKFACTTGTPEDAIETTATGGTALRYDAVAGQFVYNWKTPSTAGVCYQVVMTTQDGSTLKANFKLK